MVWHAYDSDDHAHIEGLIELERHGSAAGAIAMLPRPVDQQILVRPMQGMVGER